MIRLEGVALGAAPPDDINVVITVPAGAEPYQVGVDDPSGGLVVSQLFHSTMRAPHNLGIVPHTLSDAAAPLSAIVLSSHSLVPGLIVAARPVGVLYVSDDTGDEVTILAVPVRRLTARYDGIINYTDVPASQLRQIAHFFSHYRDMEEHRPARSAGWGDVNEARRVVSEAAERARPPIGLRDR